VNILNLKSLLKSVKLNESTISMVLGAIVIVVIGVMVVNFFGNTDQGEAIPPVETGDETKLPTFYTVQEGDDLWKISEDFYETGYNWTDIAEENDLTNANQIEVGQELTIPDVEPRSATSTPSPTPEDVEETEVIKEEDELTPTPTMAAEDEESSIDAEGAIQGTTYTVERGDTLWDISVRAYGDGYRWVDIARANELKNPNLIHRGNVFVIPR
jgi:nucleoid-associated protein YgaU